MDSVAAFARDSRLPLLGLDSKLSARRAYIKINTRVSAPLPPNLLPMRSHGTMSPCSGLTYIIVNKKTRLVLDDSVNETGFVSVNSLSENDTQKV